MVAIMAVGSTPPYRMPQAAARRMAEGEFDADRIYAAYVAAVEAQVKNPVAGAVEI